MWLNHPLSQPSSIPPPPSTTHVPPGSGKPSTHSRNKRRRKKRTDTTVVPPKGISETNTLPLGAVRRASTTTTKSVINPAVIPLPSSPSHGHATSTSLPNAVSTSAVSAAAVSSPANAQPTLPSKKRTQRDRDGPAPDVASALNAAFGTNARAGAYYAGQLHLDGVEDGIHSDSSDHDEDGGDADTGSRKKQRKADDKGKGKQEALERPTNTDGAYITQDQLMMGSLRNKNKKKGFKLSMANPIPRKIVFADGVDANVNANVNPNSNANDTANTSQHRRDAADEKEVETSTIIDVDEYDHEERHSYDHPLSLTITTSQSFDLITPFNGSLDDHSYHDDHPQAQQHPPVASASNGVTQLNGLPQRRLIPPSEIQARGELPANMFVTSVDVEADVWGAAGGAGGAGGGGDASNSNANSKKKNRKRKQQQQQEYHASRPHEDADEFHYPPPDDEVALLDYSEDPQPPSASALALSSKRNFDWVKAETNWDTSVPLTRVEQVGEGGWVGWKVGGFSHSYH